MNNQSTIAKRLGVCAKSARWWLLIWQAEGRIADKPRSGCLRKLTAAAAAAVAELVRQSVFRSAIKLAVELCSQGLADVHRSTVTRELHADGMTYQLQRRVCLLTPRHKANRVAFARQYRDLAWGRVMFSDSKYFTMHPNGAARIWVDSGAQPPTAAAPKHNPALHVYSGATYYGLANPIFVSGGSIKSKYRKANGQLQRGVCQGEYQQVILPQLIAQGDEVFQQSGNWSGHWMFQQDGARVHTAELSLNRRKQAQTKPD